MEVLWPPSVPTPKTTLTGCLTLIFLGGLPASSKLSLVEYFAAAEAKSSAQRAQFVFV